MAKYINADEVKAGAKKVLAKRGDSRRKIFAEYLIEIMDAMPAADVAPRRHGKWLNSHHAQIVTCSLCGGTVQTNWRGFYCQNCGAKMDGGRA